MAALWETGYVELTDLGTRLGPGRGKVIDPTKIWAGFVNGEAADDAFLVEYRQILLLPAEGGAIQIVALGTGSAPSTKDSIAWAIVKGSQVPEQGRVELPRRNGRLVASDTQIVWQSSDGELLLGKSLRHFT